jgi:hypothetical protein
MLSKIDHLIISKELIFLTKDKFFKKYIRVCNHEF